MIRILMILAAALLAVPGSAQTYAEAPAIATRLASRQDIVVAGRPYVVIGRPENVWIVNYQKENWIQLRCWSGDRPPWDRPGVDRIGLDGWKQPYRWGAPVDLRIRLILHENSLPEKGGWLNLFETHEKNWAGVGFIRLMLEWSNGLKRPILRLRAGNTVLWTDERPVLWQPYTLRLRFTAGGPGTVEAWMFDRQVAYWRGFVGHGPLFPLYPQFRIYRNAQARTATVYVKIDSHDEGPPPKL
jgi:hypothetical protein